MCALRMFWKDVPSFCQEAMLDVRGPRKTTSVLVSYCRHFSHEKLVTPASIASIVMLPLTPSLHGEVMFVWTASLYNMVNAFWRKVTFRKVIYCFPRKRHLHLLDSNGSARTVIDILLMQECQVFLSRDTLDSDFSTVSPTRTQSCCIDTLWSRSGWGGGGLGAGGVNSHTKVGCSRLSNNENPREQRTERERTKSRTKTKANMKGTRMFVHKI